jgi:predicted lipid-binding transport protein (Tim44 family)
MFTGKRARHGLVLFGVLLLLIYLLEIDVLARVGGGQSMGGRGSISYSLPGSPSSMPTSPSRQYSPSPPSPYQQPQSGRFLRGLAGGLVGGIIGGMLFRSLGFGGSGGMGGGMGLFDIILIGLILYGIRWFIKKKSQKAEATASVARYKEMPLPDSRQQTSFASSSERPEVESDVGAGLGYIQRMDPSFDEQRFKDQCMDNFFRIQGAWANRDMSTTRNLLTDEMYGILQRDAEDLKRSKRINRLENIAVRSADIIEAWQEGGNDFITVRFYANLLDCTVDEISGQLVSGSKTDPVIFEEYWTFMRPVGNNPWQLSAITQA